MNQLHFFFFPLMAQGHMIPTLDMAKLVASRGVKATIITTPLNESVFSDSIQRNKRLGIEIEIRLIKFHAVENELPEGCERLDLIPSPELFNNFFKATAMMQQPFENLVKECRPNCIVSDMLFPWTVDSAAKFNIPRIVFHGTSFFALCVAESIRRNKPFKNVSSDCDTFVVPNLPHEIKLTKTQLSPFNLIEQETIIFKIFNKVRERDSKSYGVIFNSFYELEPDYFEHYTKVQSKKSWAIGPFSLCNRDIEDKTERGKKSSIDKNVCLKWLDSKKSNSIIYICFGSGANFTASQIQELAMGIEDSGQDFIWVVRTENEELCVPEGFEERTKEKGLIIRGWAPQVLILDHEAIGAFVTHCGWNSTLEGISAGVPMVTWPLFAEQFFNEKLVTDVLRIVVGVGSVKWKAGASGVKREEIIKAIKRVMVGEEAEGYKNRAKESKEMARKVIEEGGSSYIGLTNLLQDISTYSNTSD